MRSATLSLAGDFFGRRGSRWCGTALLFLLGWLATRLATGASGAGGIAPWIARTSTVIVLALSISALHFTEGTRRGGFGAFPIRLFRFPVSTAMLVGVPMAGAAILVVGVYLLCARLLLSGAGDRPPLLWPCLYLVGGVTGYQAVVWALANRPWCRTAVLGVGATILAFGWMFLWPDVYAGTLSDLGYAGDPERFMAWYIAILSLAGPAAYGVAWSRVRVDRHGPPGFRWFATRSSVGRTDRSATVGIAPFRSPARALFWIEMRRGGWVLPGTVAALLLVTGLATGAVARDGAPITSGVVLAMLVVPMVAAAIVGCAFRRPDFWSEVEVFSSFQAVLPVALGSRILVKLACAISSSLLTWVVVGVAIPIWIVAFGDFEVVLAWADSLGTLYGPLERGLLMAGVVASLVVLTWRFLVAGLPFGPGAPSWLRRGSEALVFGGICGMLGWVSLRGDSEGIVGDLHAVRPLLRILPWVLWGLVLAKLSLACWAWGRVRRDGLLRAESTLAYWMVWFVVSVIPGATGYVAFSRTTWLWPVLGLLGVLAVPLARVAWAMRLLARARSKS